MIDVIAFSEEQQAAIIGHALRQPHFWGLLAQYGFTKDWVIDARVKTLVDWVGQYQERFKRAPKVAELLSEIKNKESPGQFESSKHAAKMCVDASANHGWDVLETKLVEWAKSRVVVNRAHQVRDLFNDGKHGESYEVFAQASREIAVLDLANGARDALESSIEQVKKMNQQLTGDAVETIKYGVSFLDDLTCGMGPHDLHILTGFTGKGKTELAKNVALYNAKLGKRVAFFALEADPQEIEKRIAFGLFYEWYRADHPNMLPGTINYVEFDLGQLNAVYEPYKPRVQEYFEKHLSTLRTYYRKSQDFDLKTLEANILAVHKTSDLIILDHIHYVDTEGRDENREMQDIVKKIRDLSVHLGTPMLVLAHIRKHQGGAKEKRLLPDTDAIQGAGAITKMSTATIALGPAPDISVVDQRAIGVHTLVQVMKFRKDGTRASKVALCFFNEHTRAYAPDYALGHFEAGASKWKPIKENVPYWAKHCTIMDVSDTEAA